jgi:ATP-dependent Clp protease ATP-binding subunit ClpC
VACLVRHYELLRETIETGEWKENKQTALELMSQPGFWSSPERFALLGELEHLDRVEAGLATAGALLKKLTGSSSHGHGVPRHLAERLAQQLYLLATACESIRENAPRDAFIQLEAARESMSPGSVNRDFALRLAAMYRAWAQKRRMDFKVLKETAQEEEDTYRLLAAVSGFGAYRILAPEDGLHVFEIPGAERDFVRAKAQVRVAPQPDDPGGDNIRGWIVQAEKALAASDKEGTVVVRRYRERPSPLVRDGVRKWRTGRLDRVLAGDFDLFE